MRIAKVEREHGARRLGVLAGVGQPFLRRAVERLLFKRVQRPLSPDHRHRGRQAGSLRGIGKLGERRRQRRSLRGGHPQRRHRAPHIAERLLRQLLRFGQSLVGALAIGGEDALSSLNLHVDGRTVSMSRALNAA
jgi:hypothetical protein